MKKDSNLFWVALQSNLLADTEDVRYSTYMDYNFNSALHEMKKGLKKDGWILPHLESNMRNQINISNIKIEGPDVSKNHIWYPMQSSITKLNSGTNIVGELPILFKVRGWHKKKDQILTHCVQEMNKKDKKNLVILYDYSLFKGVGKDLARLVKDKTVIEYPSNHGKQKDISNIKDFIEKDDHILFTKRNYFNGCETSNVIYLNWSSNGQRNVLMRSVKNVILVDVDSRVKIDGMKEDNRFY